MKAISGSSDRRLSSISGCTEDDLSAIFATHLYPTLFSLPVSLEDDLRVITSPKLSQRVRALAISLILGDYKRLAGAILDPKNKYQLPATNIVTHSVEDIENSLKVV